MEWSRLVLSLLLVFVVISEVSATDPCANHRVIADDGSRSPGHDAGAGYCDQDKVEQDWYQVVNAEGTLQMPSHPVPVNRCGTTHPIWLNGTYPGFPGCMFPMTACVSTPGNPCGESFQVHVKHCGYFYVFRLKEVTDCPRRYCFEKPADALTPEKPLSGMPQPEPADGKDMFRPDCSSHKPWLIAVVCLVVAVVVLGVLAVYNCVRGCKLWKRPIKKSSNSYKF